MAAPDFRWIEECYRVADDHWRAWRRDAQLSVDYVNEGVPAREWSLKLSDTSRYQEVRTTTARDKVLNGTTQLLTNELQITIEKPRAHGKSEITAKADRDADYGESVLRALLYHAGRINTNEDPVRESAINAFKSGMGALECWYDESANPRPTGVRRDSKAFMSWLAKRSDHFPLYVDAPDPLTLYPSPDDGLSWVVKRFKRGGWELAQRYPDWRPRAAAGNERWRSEEYEFFVYCDAEYYVYGVWDEGETLRTVPHYWGGVPIVIWPSGLGHGVAPDTKYRSLIIDAINAKYLIEEARILTQIDAINANRAWKSAIYPAAWGNIDFTPDKANKVDGVNAEDLRSGWVVIGGDGAPPQLYDELRAIREKIDEATIPEVIGTGVAAASDPTSKYIRRLSEGAAKLNWVRQYAQRGWERTLGLLTRALRSRKYFGADERITLRGGAGKEAFSVVVVPDRIPEDPMIRATIDPESPQEKYAKQQAGLAMRAQRDPLTGEPLIDLWTFYEDYAGFPDGGERIIRNLMRERALRVYLPLYDQFITGRATGQIPDTVRFTEYVNSQGQGDQLAQQAAVNGNVPMPGSPEEQTSMLEAMGQAGQENGFPQGRRGFQGTRGM